MSGKAGPLDGIRIIELGSLVAGPFAGHLLADLGADVIKIEAPNRLDPLREWGHAQLGGKSLWWAVQSRNKRCITLDLRQAEGQRMFLQLVSQADALLENFRPQTLERWGLGVDRLEEARPGLVLARVSGYGQTGPYASRAGFASVAEAMGGLRYINGFPDQPPPRTGISLGDSLAGMMAAIGVLAALNDRDRNGGPGQVVDVSLMESCFALMESALPEYDRLGIVRQPSGTSLKGVAPSNIFRSADDRWVVIAANNDGLFRRLSAAIGMPELAEDPRFATHGARGENQDELDRIIAEWARPRPWREIERLLNEAGVVCGPIYTVADIAEDPQFKAREMLVKHVDPDIGEFLGPGVVPQFSDTPGSVRWAGPDPGAHNSEVFGELLGLQEQELAELDREGVI